MILEMKNNGWFACMWKSPRIGRVTYIIYPLLFFSCESVFCFLDFNYFHRLFIPGRNYTLHIISTVSTNYRQSQSGQRQSARRSSKSTCALCSVELAELSSLQCWLCYEVGGRTGVYYYTNHRQAHAMTCRNAERSRTIRYAAAKTSKETRREVVVVIDPVMCAHWGILNWKSWVVARRRLLACCALVLGCTWFNSELLRFARAVFGLVSRVR